MPESEKSTKHVTFSVRRGWRSEERVLKYFQDHGWSLVVQRYRSSLCEVDLVLYHPTFGVKVVEVKSLWNWDWMAQRISPHQVKRLFQLQIWMRQQLRVPVHLNLAVVDRDLNVTVFEDLSGFL